MRGDGVRAQRSRRHAQARPPSCTGLSTPFPQTAPKRVVTVGKPVGYQRITIRPSSTGRGPGTTCGASPATGRTFTPRSPAALRHDADNAAERVTRLAGRRRGWHAAARQRSASPVTRVPLRHSGHRGADHRLRRPRCRSPDGEPVPVTTDCPPRTGTRSVGVHTGKAPPGRIWRGLVACGGPPVARAPRRVATRRSRVIRPTCPDRLTCTGSKSPGRCLPARE